MAHTTAVMFDPLLVITSVSLEQFEVIADQQDARKHIVESQTELAYIFDQPVMFLETHERNSIWNQDGRTIKPFTGKLVKDKNGSTMLPYARQNRIASAKTADVIRLFMKPKGTNVLHRLHAPVTGPERTIHAITLRLKDQAEHCSVKGRAER